MEILTDFSTSLTFRACSCLKRKCLSKNYVIGKTSQTLTFAKWFRHQWLLYHGVCRQCHRAWGMVAATRSVGLKGRPQGAAHSPFLPTLFCPQGKANAGRRRRTRPNTWYPNDEINAFLKIGKHTTWKEYSSSWLFWPIGWGFKPTLIRFFVPLTRYQPKSILAEDCRWVS